MTANSMFVVIRNEEGALSPLIIDVVSTINEATSIVADLLEVDDAGEYSIKPSYPYSR